MGQPHSMVRLGSTKLAVSGHSTLSVAHTELGSLAVLTHVDNIQIAASLAVCVCCNLIAVCHCAPNSLYGMVTSCSGPYAVCA